MTIRWDLNEFDDHSALYQQKDLNVIYLFFYAIWHYSMKISYPSNSLLFNKMMPGIFKTFVSTFLCFDIKWVDIHLCSTQVKAIAQLLIRFNWSWVGLVRADREYGSFAVQGLLRELQGSKVCVAYQEIIPLLYNRQRILEIIQVDTKMHWAQFLTTREFSFHSSILFRSVLITPQCHQRFTRLVKYWHFRLEWDSKICFLTNFTINKPLHWVFSLTVCPDACGHNFVFMSYCQCHVFITCFI